MSIKILWGIFALAVIIGVIYEYRKCAKRNEADHFIDTLDDPDREFDRQRDQSI